MVMHRGPQAAIRLTGPFLLALAGGAAAQGLPPIEHEFPNGSVVTFYGQINKGILQYDDGQETESYGLIDNDNSGTRAGIRYTQEFDGWTFENRNEISYAPYSTANINILNQTPSSEDWEFTNANIRYLDFSFDNDRFGKFWIGQGSMATDGVQEIDLSGTDVIAYSSVADSAAAQLLRLSDGTLTDIEIQDAFSNYDGPRRVRVRYDTPEFYGFTAATAYGRDLLSDDADTRDENIFDASVVYGNEVSEVEFEAGIGYYWQENNTTQWGGSVSAIHGPTGINGTFAYGLDNGSDGSYWYGKLGLLRDFFSWGATAASVDYWSGDDFFTDDGEGITSSTSDSWGLALVQNIDRANTELWLTYRSYDYADDFASYDDGRAVFGGARFRF